MKIGDLVRWVSEMNEIEESHYNLRGPYGVVVAFSRTGHETLSANVLFSDGETWWVDTNSLEIINESRATNKS